MSLLTPGLERSRSESIKGLENVLKLSLTPVDDRPTVRAHCNFKLYLLIAVLAPPSLGWQQDQAAAAALQVFLPEPVAATGTRREIEILYGEPPCTIRNLRC